MTTDAHDLVYANVPAERPGIVTALGVCSIVFGGLGLLWNAYGILTAVGMLVLANVTPPNAGGNTGNLNAGSTPAVDAATAAVIADGLEQHQTLSEADRGRLVAALQRGEVPVVPPDEGVAWTAGHVADQVSGASVVGGETHYDMGMSGDLYLRPGEVELSAWPLDGGDVSTIVADDGNFTVTATGLGNPAHPFGDMGVLPAVALMVGEAAEFVLSGVLLTAGILAVRGSRKARPWHRGWAWARIAAGLLVSAVYGWWMWSLFAGVSAIDPTGPPANVMGWFAAASAVFYLLLAWAYPVAVLIVLRTRRVREFYADQSALA